MIDDAVDTLTDKTWQQGGLLLNQRIHGVVEGDSEALEEWRRILDVFSRNNLSFLKKTFWGRLNTSGIKQR